jgi:hypothetical protein
MSGEVRRRACIYRKRPISTYIDTQTYIHLLHPPLTSRPSHLIIQVGAMLDAVDPSLWVASEKREEADAALAGVVLLAWVLAQVGREGGREGGRAGGRGGGRGEGRFHNDRDLAARRGSFYVYADVLMDASVI